jgi:hypothetical protein
MKRALCGLVLILFFAACAVQAQERFTLEQLLSAPFPDNLVASKIGNRIAWTLDEQGKRNIWVAEGPEFKARRLTSYLEDDGQELSSLDFSTDGDTLVYARGGGKNAAGQYPNPTSNPAGVEQAVWAVKWNGGEPKKIDAGHSVKGCLYARWSDLDCTVRWKHEGVADCCARAERGSGMVSGREEAGVYFREK